ncbi:MAG: hypothetical protein RLZZ90_219, partial [Actinomycetota bacterium]
MTAKILIIGAGQAGMQIAVSLRESEFAGDITIVGEEAYAPYQRPPLSKAYLAGDSDEESLEFRNPNFYAENRIKLVTGEKIIGAEFGENGGVATAASGKTYS